MHDKELHDQYILQIPGLLAELERTAKQWVDSPEQENFDHFFTKVLDSAAALRCSATSQLAVLLNLCKQKCHPFLELTNSLARVR